MKKKVPGEVGAVQVRAPLLASNTLIGTRLYGIFRLFGPQAFDGADCTMISADLTNKILSTVQSPELWGDAIDCYVDEFSILNSVLFSLRDFDLHRARITHGPFLRQPELRDLAEQFNKAEDEGDQRLYHSAFAVPALTVMSERSVLRVSDDDPLPPSAFRAKLEAAGARFRSGTVLNRTGPWLDLLAAQHATAEELKQYINHKSHLVAATLFARAIELGRAFDELRSVHKAALAALDFLQLGVVLVGARGQVIFHNKEAERILALADGVYRTRDGRLRCELEPFERALDATISSIDAGAIAPIASEHVFVVARRSTAFDLIVSVAPLKDTAGEFERDLTCAFVLMVDPDRGEPLDTRALAALGGLSKAEMEVVDGLARGLKLDEIAEARSTSRNTVRNQFRSLAAKLRCATQSDVLRLAALTRLPIIRP